MKQFKWLASFVWYGLGVYLALSYIQWRLFRAWPPARDFPSWVGFAKAGLELVLLVAFFVLIHFAIRAAIAAMPPTPPPVAPQTGESFPSEVTEIVGIWLLVLAGICTIGLFFALNASCWPEWLQRCLENKPEFRNALATMFGAGVGSVITTILGYLEHASEKKDFERAYAPWYVGRPLMGLLLGLVFYFLLRGGLLAVMPSKAEAQDLSVAGLAGVGSLVGLFSKNAIEKLRELFDTLFSTKKGAEQSVLDRLPPELKKQVAEHLTGSSGEGTQKST